MSVPSRRYLSVWLRRLSTDRVERSSGAPGDAPLLIVETVKSALRVSALNDAAAELGLKTGMPLADVRAMYPFIAVHDADRAADGALLSAVADWCDRYTPLVGLDPPDGLFLDISGCAHLFGGEQALGRDLLARLKRQGLKARIGLADTPGCAWAVARYGAKTLVPPGAAREALLPLPLTALRIEDRAFAGLARAGLKRIADIVARPRAPLAARFGQVLLHRLDCALGLAEESIVPRLPVPAYVAERRLPEPIARQDDVLGIVEQLARELNMIMNRRGEGARLLQISLFRADGKVYRFEAAASTPLRDPERICRLFIERFIVIGDECDPGFGYDMVRLSALSAERFDASQIGLDTEDATAALEHLVDRLSARFGAYRVTQPIPRDTHIPEEAAMAAPAQDVRDTFILDLLALESLAPVRPLRLFEQAEPVDVVAEVPDGPPARFRWRNVSHEVTAAEGPERIAMDWWLDGQMPGLTRDYFRVESRQGARVWLYREGLYDRETQSPQWFLHGLFA